jgi:dTDP-L-rhamnose 4-epimerase
MKKRVLITGGAGFIGSHLANDLLKRGYKVRILDLLSPELHGMDRLRPSYLHSDIEFLFGDLRNREVVSRVLQDVDIVYHFAAKVDSSRTLYETSEITSINSLGTAIFLEGLKRQSVERLIVASSMNIYGEGSYVGLDGNLFLGRGERSEEQLHRKEWDLRGENGESLIPIATAENKTPVISSIYALSKFDQERMCHLFGKIYHIPTVSLRFFNVYGPHQSMNNPYNGTLGSFAARLLMNKAPLLFEDGLQQRDFVSIYDAVRACALALNAPLAVGETINIGSGVPHTLLEIAEKMIQLFQKDFTKPEITGSYCLGDVRHCFADITRAKIILNYEPLVSIWDGLDELAKWFQDKTFESDTLETHDEMLLQDISV